MGKSKPKQEVNLYYMSIHFGICAEADAIKRIVIKEKEAWVGYETTQATITINKPELFGGNKKEGGAAGTVHWLPGPVTQVLPDVLATRLGRANGADAPGYRGLASAFFVGGGVGSGAGGLAGLFSILKVGNAAGFYWSANQPYLPGTWITVQRAPKGLDPAIALILRPGTNYFPYETLTTTLIGSNGFTNVAGGVVARYNDQVLEWWDLESGEQAGYTGTASDAFTGTVGSWALANDGTAYTIGQCSDGGVGVLSALYEVPVGGPSSKVIGDAPWFIGPTRVFDVGGERFVYTGINDLGGYVDRADYVPATNCGRDFCVDDAGDIWQLSQPLAASADLVLTAMSGATREFTFTGSYMRSATTDPLFCHVAEYDHFFVIADGYFYTIDDTTGAIKDSGAFLGSETVNLPHNDPTRISFWSQYVVISLEDGSVVRTIDPTDWLAEVGIGQDLYAPGVHALWTDNGTHINVRFLDRGGVDANPSHIIYECLTNTDWGMGSPTTLIDFDSFADAAQTLYDEPLGLSMIWTRQASIQDFVQEVLDHIQAVLFVDPQTGLLTLKLIRGDYDVGDLSTIDPSSATLTNFGRKLWGEIVNEITVTWTNPDNEQDETVTVHDLASITTQGGIVSDSRNYYGVRDAQVAARLAARDLRSAGAPLATCEAEVDRTQWALRPASVLKLDWPEYGLVELVMRVTSIDYGKPGDPTIKLSLIEDVFGLDAGAYVEPPTSSWEDPSSAPAPLEHEAVFTMPLYFAANSTVAAFVDSPEYPEVIAGVLGTTSNTDTFSWELWDEVPLPDGTPEWTNLQTNNVIGYAELLTALDAEVSTTLGVADFDTAMGETGPSTGGFVLIGDGTEESSEIALITAAGTGFTISRGVLDTVPRSWPIGTPVWFLDAATLFEDPLIRSAFEEVSYKFRTRTSQGLLSLAGAPLVEYTLTERPWLPNRPADVKAYGVAFSGPTDAIDAIARPDPWVTVTWANRNRLTEDAQVLAWSDATTAPETDQTTTITVLAASDGVTVLDTHDGLTGTSFDVPDASFGSEPVVILRTSSERTDADGTFGSLQAFDHWVTVGFAGGTEAVAGAGAFSGTGAAIRPAAFSASGVGALGGTGIANSAGALSGNGAGALSAVGMNGAGPTATPHRYWRIYIGTNSGDGSSSGQVVSAAEIELRESVGGADVTGSGTASSDSNFSGFTAAGAFANDGVTTEWASAASAYPHWIAYDFGSGVTKAIVEVAIQSRNGLGPQGPAQFKVQSSDDGSTWADEWWVVYPGGSNGHGYTNGAFVSFTKPLVDQSPSASRHRYFRCSITGSTGGSYVGARFIELRTVSGSVDETEGGTATSRSNFSGLPPSNAFDGMKGDVNLATEWASNNVGFPEWIQYDFGSGNDKMINEVIFMARAGLEASQAPTGIDFQVSDNGSSWTTVKSVSSLSWTTNTPKTWAIP